jgi:hypothetical protein
VIFVKTDRVIYKSERWSNGKERGTVSWYTNPPDKGNARLSALMPHLEELSFQLIKGNVGLLQSDCF